jgi:hypothetical protein
MHTPGAAEHDKMVSGGVDLHPLEALEDPFLPQSQPLHVFTTPSDLDLISFSPQRPFYSPPHSPLPWDGRRQETGRKWEEPPKGSTGTRGARRTARMAVVHQADNAVAAANLMLPRATLLERTELAVELDAVAAFHYPGVSGWADLTSSEKVMVWPVAGKRLQARREALKTMRHQRFIQQTMMEGTEAIKSLPAAYGREIRRDIRLTEGFSAAANKMLKGIMVPLSTGTTVPPARPL